MLNTLAFAGGQYALLAAWLFGCWGVGWALLRGMPGSAMTEPVAIALGIGIWICALQALGIGGALTRTPVLMLAGFGAICGAMEVVRRIRNGRQAAPGTDRAKASTTAEKWTFVAVALLAVPTLLAPLSPPMAWDELAYHLPHAQQWAATGRLQINDWLRYPWFPSNYDLLFAGALLFGNDILPHLLHAAAGWLTAWLIYGLGVRHLRDRVAGGAAVALWLILSKSQYDRAYIDMGATLFILVACAALLEWHGTQARRWLVVSAFSLGVAAGAKYQVLALLPFFAVVLAMRDRRPTTWLMAVFALALPCIYWYARNAWLTGDPFNPIGGRLFGFSDWNLADYQGQFADLRDKAGWPDWLLWPAVAVPFIAALHRRPAVRGALALGGYMLFVWVVTSRYPRYLMTAYPVLVLLSAAGACHVVRVARRRASSALAPRVARVARVARFCGALLMLCVLVAGTTWTLRHAQRIAVTPAEREALLLSEVNGYGMWAWLRENPSGRIYQLGLEESLYYAPHPVWGDVFGPWRYADVVALPPAAMHRKLISQGFDALVLDTARWPALAGQAGFDRFFILRHTEGAVRLYRVSPNESP
ncbi:ArnT family glycosyltransferase [Variovorax sp. RHLX14]|uniref:ArnT family glycosyltransferase n=1 Tax=Variovorax sp. RHLX14 TaxID=1259731 RepID=UPI003F4655C6